MKTRILYITLAAAMLSAIFCLPVFTTMGEDRSERYHQHLEEPGYTPCEDHGDEVFCTHLPIVVIDTEGQEIPGVPTDELDRFGEELYTVAEDGTDYINVSVTVIDNDEGNNHLTDKFDFTTRSLFRVRGHSSRRFEKSPYLLKFVDENGLDNDLEVMGMDAHHEWVLYGPYLDKSLVRNYMWYNISGELMHWAPNVRYCELFIDGDYRGLYLMTETITNGDTGRLNLKDTVKGNELNGYLICINWPAEKELETTRDIYSFSERIRMTGNDIALRYPGKNTLTPELAKDIELDFSAFEKALYSYDHDTEDYGYWNWINVDDFVDYYLINEFTANQDAMQVSTYLYKEPGQKMGICVWDFNNCCDNFVDEEFNNADLLLPVTGYYRMITMDETFTKTVLERYAELRKTYFSEEYLQRYIDETIAWLGPAAERNYKRWKAAYDEDMLHTRESGRNRNQYTVGEAATYLKKWLDARAAWLDDHLDAIQFYSHPSSHKRWEH